MLVRASPNKEEFYHSHNTNISEAEGDFNTTAFKLTKTYLISECGKTGYRSTVPILGYGQRVPLHCAMKPFFLVQTCF